MKTAVIVVGVLALTLLSVAEARRPWKGVRGLQKRLCQYDKGNWTDCDPVTNTVSRQLTLSSGGPECTAEFDQSVSCERFERMKTWREKKLERQRGRQEKRQQAREERLNALKERKQRKQQLRQEARKGKFERKQRRKEEKERRREERKQQQKLRQDVRLRCKYDKAEWSQCNETTQLVTRQLALREGEDGCEATFEMSIPCERYERIQAWRAKKAEMKEQQKERKQQRKEELTQLKADWKATREQKRLGCDFEVTFSDCDPENSTVTKTYTPVNDADDVCESRSSTYSCELHNNLMAKKGRRQEKRKEKRKERRQNRRDFFRQS